MTVEPAKKFRKVALADDYMVKVCEAYGVDPGTVRRVVIDGTAGSPLRIYFDCYGGDALLNLRIPADAEVHTR